MDQFIQDIARGAGEILKNKFKKVGVKYEKTGSLDVVTEADLLANEFIVNAIKREYPEHGIISEETGEENIDSEYVWIIDPLDGTFNFATGVPFFCTMIALARNREIQMGCIYDPIHDELCFAEKGRGTFLNNIHVHCSSKSEIKDSAGTTGAKVSPEKLSTKRKLQEMGSDKAVVINAWGCVGVSNMYVAVGRRDWFVNPKCGLWDLAPGVILLAEAGCRVTNMEGEPWSWKDRSMIAANPGLHTQLLEQLQ